MPCASTWAFHGAMRACLYAPAREGAAPLLAPTHSISEPICDEDQKHRKRESPRRSDQVAKRAEFGESRGDPGPPVRVWNGG